MQHLNAREWLESQRLAGCEFAVELLDLLDAQDYLNECVKALEEIEYIFNRRVRLTDTLFDTDPNELASKVCDRLDEFDEIEILIYAESQGMTWPNGTVIATTADRLRAMFESGRWLEHDL